MTWLLALALAASNADADNIARIDFIQQRLDAGTHGARAWFWTWEGLYAGTAIGQGIGAALVKDKELRANLIVGGAESLIGAVALLIPPFRAAFAAKELRDEPADTEEQRIKKRVRAEEILRDTADNEIWQRGWFTHVGGAVVALAGGLVTWLVFHYLIDGIVTTAASMAVCEVQIWTQPMRSVRDWEEYQVRYGGAASAPVQAGLHFAPYHGGLMAFGAF